MRIIIDENNYIYDCSLGGQIDCDEYGTCQEYTGACPDGYDDVDDWFLNCECKSAWKLQDGNLVLDANKQVELETQYEIDAEENATATHKWVRNQMGKDSEVVIDELSTNASDSKLVILENSGSYDIPEIVLYGTSVSGIVNVIASNRNLLGNKAVTTTESGITFTINTDKTININGTSTSAIELTLDGTAISTDMLFLIKENIDYIKSGLATGVSLSLYNYDGTDRTLVDSGGNGLINLTAGAIITQTTLSIASGTTFDNVLISPQIEVASEESAYTKHLENKTSGTLEDNKLIIDNELDSYEPTTIIMCDRDLNINVIYFTGQTTAKIETAIEVLDDSITSSVSDIQESLSTIGEAVEIINSTMLTQTADQFEMLFKQTGIKDLVDTIDGLVNSNTASLNELVEYIRFKGASIELGKSTSNIKLLLENNMISFIDSGSTVMYITNRELYIDGINTKKVTTGHWVIEEDADCNLNRKWVND